MWQIHEWVVLTGVHSTPILNWTTIFHYKLISISDLGCSSLNFLPPCKVHWARSSIISHQHSAWKIFVNIKLKQKKLCYLILFQSLLCFKSQSSLTYHTNEKLHQYFIHTLIKLSWKLTFQSWLIFLSCLKPNFDWIWKLKISIN